MRGADVRQAVTAAAVLGALLIPLGGCGGPSPSGSGGTSTGTPARSAGTSDGDSAGRTGTPTGDAARSADPVRSGDPSAEARVGGGDPQAGDPQAGDPQAGDPRLPGVGDRLQRRVPADSRQAVVVYGDSRDSADATLVLYTRQGSGWERSGGWPAHNGKKGWTTDHHEGDRRSPVGVFTLSDAGGVLPDPGSALPYTRSAAMAAPRWWPKSYWHDFDYVIAIDYNRVRGTPPDNQARPGGYAKGGGIWLHLDHGSGTSACVSVSKAAMRFLLRTLDPDRHPVVVMGDRADLKA